ncbi:F-box/kelch-repeat protein At5g43190 [Punica granatum]|nr:F-box/kelch-repeat protein At5g43190 [Punica granatum]
MTKSLRKIDFPTFPFSFEHLTFVSAPLGYKIFITSNATAFLYDSRFHSWRRFRFDSPDFILSDSSYQEGVYFDGSLYFTVSNRGPSSIVCLDPESGKLEPQVSDLPQNITFTRLANDGERKLYLVGGIGTNGISRAMKLWELSGEGKRKRWVEVESLPELMCRKFMSVCYHNYEHVYCFWHQGMICICCYTWPEILYYKVRRRTWHWLPKCPSLPEKWSCGFRWFSFLPEFSAVV